MNRREFLQVSAAAGIGLASGPRALATAPDLPPSLGVPSWLSALGTGLEDGHDYRPEVTGRIPEALRGTLYRNGPGLFERSGYAKRHLLDGDGMIQAFDLGPGGARYRNHFVRTSKYLAEEKAGRFLEPTWTTLAPEWHNNLPGFPTRSQAGITPVVHHGALFALDEVGEPFELDPATLEDRGERAVVAANAPGSWKAHTKIDGRTGDWVLLGWSTGMKTQLNVVILDRDGNLKVNQRVDAPRGGYIHDFFASERYVIVNLHALTLHPFGLLAGMRSVTDSLEWTPEIGNLLVVIDKSGKEAPRILEAPASFMWHAFNAWEDGDHLYADFIGYDNPDHFIGEDPVFRSIMQGREAPSHYPGTVRRYAIDLTRNRLDEETIAAGHHEFPMIHPARSGYGYRYGYACLGTKPGSWFHNALVRIDMRDGTTDAYDFGDGVYASEPVFAPDPGKRGETDGWLMSVVLERDSGRSALAVLDARRLADGPVATIRLRHHTPLSFHGFWQAA